ncbi:S-layer homology domain-containing protein [Paenibacillus sp. ISL-20]|uniref:S-layer homology domain-containing protein n=1 Tax=Paenibacillus sp. ISL-20 TaxID=2819163 RepID=UPI001BE800D6|nr:S-layer homology domain-containing protein [Paenibacillus sp. ISL-20]MBT2761264.1 S-layer homology domain-containing protein [Paenibacillus sp. ISL-20]
MKLKNQRRLSLLMTIVVVLTMLPFYPLEARAATTPTLNLGNPVSVTEATYQLPNAAFESTGVINGAGGYFTVTVNSGSIAVGTVASGITELTDGIKISGIVTDQSTPTNRVFNFSSNTTYEDIQAVIRNMKFTQDPGKTQSVTVNVTPGAPLTDGKTSVRIYDGRYFVYVARQSTMQFKDAVTTATNNSGHLVEPTEGNPEEMFAIANMFKEFKSPFRDSWNLLSFIGATKSTERTNWSTIPFNSNWTKYVSNGQPTNLENTKEYVANGNLIHLTLLLDTTNNKVGYLAVDNTHGGTSNFKDPGVIVEYNPGVISNIITTTQDIQLPVMGGSVTIDGTAKVGETLTANVTGITYTPNTTDNVPTFQWYRNGVAIPNATGLSYTLTADDVGAAITVRITADGIHASGSVTSKAVVTDIDKTQLQATVDKITGENLQPADYTPLSWQALQDALTEADRILQDPNATQIEIDQANENLKNAYENLVTIDAILDKLDLRVANSTNHEEIELSPPFNGNKYLNYKASVTDDVYSVAVALELLNSGSTAKLSFNGSEVPDPSDWNDLQLHAGLNVIQVEVTIGNRTNIYTVEIVKTDKTALQSKVDKIGTLNSTDYTQESWDKLQEALKEANNVLNDPKATQEEVNKALEALEKAQEGLVPAEAPGNNGGGETTSPGTGSGTNSGTVSTPNTNSSGVTTTVNGKDSSFATSTTKTDGEGNHTTVQVDSGKLSNILAQGDGQKLAIRVPVGGDTKVQGLTAADIKKLADTGSTLEIEDLLAIYPVPGKQLDLDAIAKQSNNAKLEDIAVRINIKRSPQDLTDGARKKAAAEGYELLVTPVDLDLTFTHGDKTVRSGELNGYAPKYIALPEGIDPNRITTGVIVNPDGSVFHVPTVVTKIDNRYFALINDLRSSGTYSVIWNPQDFDDVQYHWGRADVNNIAARLDLEGTGNNTFSPNKNVTRAEFAEIVVLGLGLMRQDAMQNIFPDVPASAWYRNAVALADEYDIVRGYADGSFKGGQQITREQGFAMIARAHRMIDTTVSLSEGQAATVLSRYKDAADVAAWARADVAQLITAGIIQGNGPELLSPKKQMTRVEVTALIARMLKETNLIDK